MEKEKDRNINVWLPLACPLLGTWLATQACALTWNQTSDPLVCRPVLNPLSHTSQGQPLDLLSSECFIHSTTLKEPNIVLDTRLSFDFLGKLLLVFPKRTGCFSPVSNRCLIICLHQQAGGSLRARLSFPELNAYYSRHIANIKSNNKIIAHNEKKYWV